MYSLPYALLMWGSVAMSSISHLLENADLVPEHFRSLQPFPSRAIHLATWSSRLSLPSHGWQVAFFFCGQFLFPLKISLTTIYGLFDSGGDLKVLFASSIMQGAK